jgi:hypothetical protein
MAVNPRNDEGTWGVRRIIIITTLALCAFVVLRFTLFRADDTEVNSTLVMGAFTLAGAVIGSYVFGAVWDDIEVRKERRRDRLYDRFPYDDRPV